MDQWVLLAEIEWDEHSGRIAHDNQQVVPWILTEYCSCHYCFVRKGVRVLDMHLDFAHSWVHGSHIVRLVTPDE
jgi:hypothetical protein